MDELLRFFALFALGAFSLLCIYGIIALKNFMTIAKNTEQKFNRLEKEFDTIQVKVIQSLDNVIKLTDKSIETLNNTDTMIEKLKDATDVGVYQSNKVVNMLEPLNELIHNVVHKIAPPITKVATYVSAGSKAVDSFISFFKSKQKSPK